MTFLVGGGQFLRLQGTFVLFKISLSDAINVNEDERIYTSEYSSALGIRVGVPHHLTKFDAGGVRRWRGFNILGCVNA